MSFRGQSTRRVSPPALFFLLPDGMTRRVPQYLDGEELLLALTRDMCAVTARHNQSRGEATARHRQRTEKGSLPHGAG